MLNLMRSLLSNGLVRAKVLGALRDIAKTAGGAVGVWLIALLVGHGMDGATATTYGLALGGLVATFLIWAGSLALSWIDKDKVNVQLKVAAATGQIVPVAGVLRPASVAETISAAKAGNF